MSISARSIWMPSSPVYQAQVSQTGRQALTMTVGICFKLKTGAIEHTWLFTFTKMEFDWPGRWEHVSSREGTY